MRIYLPANEEARNIMSKNWAGFCGLGRVSVARYMARLCANGAD